MYQEEIGGESGCFWKSPQPNSIWQHHRGCDEPSNTAEPHGAIRLRSIKHLASRGLRGFKDARPRSHP